MRKLARMATDSAAMSYPWSRMWVGDIRFVQRTKRGDVQGPARRPCRGPFSARTTGNLGDWAEPWPRERRA